MISLTFRRYYLDKLLTENISNFKGKILDIGGVKKNRRGNFQIPCFLEHNWFILNNNPNLNPDILATLPEIPTNEKYNTIILTEVIEYIPDTLFLLEEINRVLMPEGHLFISTPFLHPLHGDKEADLYRFTETYLMKILLKDFELIKFVRMGGLFAVIYDQIRTYLISKNTISFSTLIAAKVLKFTSLFVLFLDKMTINKNEYVNTGFWIELRKK